MFMISTADELVDYLKDFTGSNNTNEIKQCIFQAELAMRNIELPALRSNPYDAEYIGTVGDNSMMEIPADMNKPILFFQQGTGQAEAESYSSTGPWLVYDRVGDRDIITMSLVSQFYLNPVNVPAVIRGKFSEVGQKYQFTPWVASGTLINMYYYRAWNLLFTPAVELVSTTGTVGSITGASSPWTAAITGMTTNDGFEVGQVFTATAGTGSLGTGGVYTVASLVGSTGITFTATGGTTPTNGTITNIQYDTTIQTNQILQSWPEGYVYGALHEYYIKRHSDQDAAVYKAKFDEAWRTVENQNSLGKWSGGSTRLSSIWQPRRFRNYSVK
jgi:hypothetical protein